MTNSQMKHNFLILLCAVAIAGQIACNRSTSTTNPSPSPSPTPAQVALIDQIFDRYTAAIGGQEAVDRITSYKTKGTFDLAGRQGKLEIWAKDPDKNLTTIEIPGFGTIKKGFDGENRWVQTPVGTFTASGEEQQEITEIERDADIYRAGKIKNFYQSVKLDSKARLSGRDVYVVQGEQKKGPAEKMFFDVENGLLLRWDLARRRPGKGTLWVKVHLNDYRDVDGVKVPFKVRYAFESFNFTITIDELQHNVPIDDAIFKKP